MQIRPTSWIPRMISGLNPRLYQTNGSPRGHPAARPPRAGAGGVGCVGGWVRVPPAAALKIMHLIVQDASPSHVEVVVVADGLRTAREVGGDVMSMARNRFGDRTSWRHVPARRIQHVTRSQEEGRMASTRPRPVPLSEAELRAQEWEASFRRAESLLREAQDTLRRQLERTAQPVRAAPPDAAPNGRAERA